MPKEERIEMRDKKRRLKNFRGFLDRVMDSAATAGDWKWLCNHCPQRKAHHSSGEGEWSSKEVNYLFPTNKAQLAQNYECVKALGTNIVTCFASHTGAGSSSHDKNTSGGLCAEVPLAVGASVSITFNLWTEAGLANGTKGIVVGLIFPAGKTAQDGPPLCILVQLGESYLGPSFLDGAEGKVEMPRVIKLSMRTNDYSVQKKPASRTNFPLMLATDVHS